jgi:hypothetical protein
VIAPSTRRASALAVAAALGGLALGGCATEHPPQLSRSALVEAETFPYYRIYWVGPRFEGRPLAAVDGTESYSTTIGDSVYYGDCINNTGLLGGGGSCRLPLQVTTVIYRRHYNAPLGPQSNTLIRGVPAVTYDEGRSIELYSGHTSIDVFSATAQGALRAAWALRTLNTPGSPSADLPPPVFCPGLAGPQSPQVQSAMLHLPGEACQKDAAVLTATERLREKPRSIGEPGAPFGPTGPFEPTGPGSPSEALRSAGGEGARTPPPARRSRGAGRRTRPSRSAPEPTG